MYRKMFTRATEVSYLDTAAEGLPHPQCERAFCDYLEAKSRGTPGRTEHYAAEAQARSLAAQLLGTDVANVTFVASASDALGMLAASVHWQAGDQIVTTDLEFPSNILPWLHAKQSGAEVKVIASQDGSVNLHDILKQISDKTRVVALSLVSYRTGAYFPHVAEVADEAHKHDAIVVVDATQGLGRCPVSLAGVDYLVSSSFKWLLGPHGLGLVYMSSGFRKRFDPAVVGWYSLNDAFSADRFERYALKDGAACMAAGMPNFPSLYAIRHSLELLLRCGLENLFRTLSEPVQQLRRGLSELELDLLTPVDPALASGIVSFSHPKAETIGKAMERAGVVVWGGDGRVRASIHIYNDMEDVVRLLHVLKKVQQTQ